MSNEYKEALEQVATAAAAQLRNHGKGLAPSPRLEEAFERASELLGYDVTIDQKAVALDAEIKRLRELKAQHDAR